MKTRIILSIVVLGLTVVLFAPIIPFHKAIVIGSSFAPGKSGAGVPVVKEFYANDVYWRFKSNGTVVWSQWSYDRAHWSEESFIAEAYLSPNSTSTIRIPIIFVSEETWFGFSESPCAWNYYESVVHILIGVGPYLNASQARGTCTDGWTYVRG